MDRREVVINTHPTIIPAGTVLALEEIKNNNNTLNTFHWTTREDLDWQELCLQTVQLYCKQHSIAYYLSKGRPRGVPSCRGCDKLFQDRKEPRIQTTIAYNYKGNASKLVTVNFCMDVNCLESGLGRYQRQVIRNYYDY